MSAHIINVIENVNQVVNGFVWGPFMLALLVGTGVIISIRSGFPQITKLKVILKNTGGKLFSKDIRKKDESGISQYQAIATALASTVGTGNISGVATAIVAGGPGAIFWMWVSALFGIMTKFAEVTLSVKYREKNEKNEWVGGPMYYIENGLHMRWLGVLFAVFAAVASLGTGNMAQCNSISVALSSTLNISTSVTGIGLCLITSFVIFGGISRIARVTEKLVPMMGAFYILLGLVTIGMNIEVLPAAFGVIFKSAFNPQAAFGGALGYTVMNAVKFGIARGVFSNEAGLGSGPIAHAASNTDHPVKQGMWGAFEVIFSTFIICTITGLVIIMSGLWTEGAALDGAALSIEAFSGSVGALGKIGVSFGIVLFALSTLLGWSYYGEKAIEYVFKGKNCVGAVKFVYKLIYIGMCYVGSVGGLQLVWGISDTLNGMMAMPNLIALIALSGTVTRMIKDYLKNGNTVKEEITEELQEEEEEFVA